MRAMQRVAATAVIGLSAVLGAGLQASAQIKIGSVVSATGPASFLGDPEKRTLEIYVDEINAKGGVNGNTIKLIVYDDGGDADKARTFATRLVEEDKVGAVLGGSTTGSTMAMMPVFEDAQIPFISLAGAVVIVEPVARNTCSRRRTPTRMACEKIFEHLKNSGLTKIGMISGTDGFGKSMRDQCVQVPSDTASRSSARKPTGRATPT